MGQPPVPAPPAAKKKSNDNLLLLLLLLLLIPIAAAVWWCCKKEPVNQPVAKPMAPVYLPQNYPVLEMSPNPAQIAPMPPYVCNSADGSERTWPTPPLQWEEEQGVRSPVQMPEW